MNAYYGNKYERISKAAAKKLYEAGQKVYSLPCKLNPESPWNIPDLMTRARENGYTFDRYYNEAAYYSCRYETGYYLAFYKEV